MGKILSEESDENLMRSVAARGDLAAFEEIYRRYQARVYRLVRRLVSQDSDAEDAHCHTFSALYFRAGTYRHPMPVRPWLFSIAVREARRVCLSAERSPDPVDPGVLPLLARVFSSEENPLTALERKEFVGEVDRVIAALPQRSREVVLLRLRARMRYSEIGEALGIREASARRQMYEALVRIRNQISSGDES